MIKEFAKRYHYAVILLKQLVKTDFKLRYQNSALGYLWSLLKPLFLFAILYVVFVKVLKIDYGVDNNGAYLFIGLVLWSFFTELTGSSVGAIVSKGDLLRKLNFPKYVIVLATAFAAIINLSLNLIVVTIFLIFGGAEIGWSSLFVVLLFVELFVLAIALAFFLSAMFVKLRDIGHVWDVVLQALFYATPILFPISMAPLWLQKILILNPAAQIIQDVRFLLISNNTATIATIYSNGLMRLVPILITLLIGFMATLYFRRRSHYFAEEI